ERHPAEVVRGAMVEGQIARTHQFARTGFDVASREIPRHGSPPPSNAILLPTARPGQRSGGRMMQVRLRPALEVALHATIVDARRVHGGDVAVSYALDLDDGRRVFAKTHPTAPPDFFTTEAAGLEWLRTPGVIPVPGVLAVSDAQPNYLVLEWIDEGGRA